MQLLDGDPLGTRMRCERILRAGGWLLPARRVWLRACARIARDWVREWQLPDRARPRHIGAAFTSWLDQRIESALLELAEEQLEEERAGRAVDVSEDAAFYRELAGRLRVEPAEARRFCAQLNVLPRGERRRLGRIRASGSDAERNPRRWLSG